MERAEFTARLIEATIRLDALSARPAGEAAWESALIVAAAEEGFAATGEAMTPHMVSRYLTLSADNPSSIRCCLDNARGNARAVRTALSRDAWAAINRAWLSLRGDPVTDRETTMVLVETVKAETRGFEGALHRMLRNESSWFLGLGAGGGFGHTHNRRLSQATRPAAAPAASAQSDAQAMLRQKPGPMLGQCSVNA